MSSESLSSDTVEEVRDAVSGAVDGDDLSSLLDGEDGAGSVGRELGARAGRELGATIGRELGELVAADVMDGKEPRAILADVKRRVRDLLLELLRDLDVDALVSRLTDAVGGVVSGGSPTDAVDSLLPEEDGSDGESVESGGAEGTEESQETDEAGAEDQQGGDESIPDGDLSSLSADDLSSLKEDTYRELLEVLSYRDLQSIAKEVGVKANLGEDEMTDRIIEQFSEQSDGDASDGDADSDES